MANSEEACEDLKSINYVSSADVSSYLIRKNKRMLNCMFTPLRREGVEKLHELWYLT